jgi:L,D-transpeptidase catalytic domain
VKHAVKWRKFTNERLHFIRGWRRAVGGHAMVASLCLVSSNGQIGEAGQRTEKTPKPDRTSVVLSLTQGSATCKSQNGCTEPLPILRETGYANVKNQSYAPATVRHGRLWPRPEDPPGLFRQPKMVHFRRKKEKSHYANGGIHRVSQDCRMAHWECCITRNYIIEGLAIHGSRSVPSRPASHGCIRIPISAAKEFSDTTPNGTIACLTTDDRQH